MSADISVGPTPALGDFRATAAKVKFSLSVFDRIRGSAYKCSYPNRNSPCTLLIAGTWVAAG